MAVRANRPLSNFPAMKAMSIRPLLCLCSIAALLGCAGSPVDTVNPAVAKAVIVDNDSIYVVKRNGVWLASFVDYLTVKQVVISPSGVSPIQQPTYYFDRKAKLARAIQTVSGCSVTDLSDDPMELTMRATVDCRAPLKQ